MAKALSEWVERLTERAYEIANQNDIPRDIAYQRFHVNGWTAEDAITIPVKRWDGSPWPAWKETCKKNGVSNPLFNARIKKQGMTPEEAATTPVGKLGGNRYVRV